MVDAVKVGLIGCGHISGIYLKNARMWRILEVVACADIEAERARARAAEFAVPRVCSVDELLADPEIELVLNLTVPAAHSAIAEASLRAGKAVYNEKPLAISRHDAQHLLALAAKRGLRVGCAPDTFLGAGLQTCRKLIDEGAIGQPVAASAFMAGHGPESWHPTPHFFYQYGAGPMFDMGPYYLTALVSLLGPVRRVTGATRISLPQRAITSAPHAGETITVTTPTHIAGVLDFAQGAIASIITSFDVWAHHLPYLEIYGTDGSMSLPDPNMFAGPVRVKRAGANDWQEIPLAYGYSANSRGLGVADMASAMRSGRPHRASGELASHILDIMHAFDEASIAARHVILSSNVERPAPLPLGLAEGTLDE